MVLAFLPKRLPSTVRYWMEVEVHVYAFSVSASVLLSFFPFLIVMVSLCRYVFHVPRVEDAIYFAVTHSFPDEIGEFLVRNLKAAFWQEGRSTTIFSIFLLFLTANGVFEPLEVALNRALGVPKNRSYFHNQMVSLGLIFACGALALLSLLLTASNEGFIDRLGRGDPLAPLVSTSLFKLAALTSTITVLFLVYWLLPNTKIASARVVPVAIVIGVLLEGLKHVILVLWPWLSRKLTLEYGPFKYSAMILLFSFLASMLVLGAPNGLAAACRLTRSRLPIRPARLPPLRVLR